jgi:hypothetical protein
MDTSLKKASQFYSLCSLGSVQVIARPSFEHRKSSDNLFTVLHLGQATYFRTWWLLPTAWYVMLANFPNLA